MNNKMVKEEKEMEIDLLSLFPAGQVENPVAGSSDRSRGGSWNHISSDSDVSVYIYTLCIIQDNEHHFSSRFAVGI